jgi:hypothetical protein
MISVKDDEKVNFVAHTYKFRPYLMPISPIYLITGCWIRDFIAVDRSFIFILWIFRLVFSLGDSFVSALLSSNRNHRGGRVAIHGARPKPR